MDNNSNPQDAQDMQEALEAYQAYKAHKAASSQTPDTRPLSYTPGGIPGGALQANPEMDKDLAATGLTLAAMPLAGPMEGAGFLSRTAVNAGAGGLQKYLSNLMHNKDDLTEGVPTAAATSAKFSVGADAISGILSGVGRAYRTVKGAINPAGLQDQAIGAVSDATDKLRSSEAENLKQYLGGKTLNIDTSRIRGIHPEIDDILGKYASPYGEIPSEANVSAEDANKIRSLLDQEMSYRKLGPFAQSAETAARDSQIKPLADQLRGQVHDVSPDVSDTLDQWSDNLNAACNLNKRAETAPMTVLTSPSFDRRSLLQKVDSRVGTNLQDLGHEINDSKNLSNAIHQAKPVKAALTLGKSGVTGMFNGVQDGSVMSNPEVLQSLFGVKNASSGQ